MVCIFKLATQNVTCFLRSTFAPCEFQSGSRSKRTERNFDYPMKNYAKFYDWVVWYNIFMTVYGAIDVFNVGKIFIMNEKISNENLKQHLQPL